MTALLITLSKEIIPIRMDDQAEPAFHLVADYFHQVPLTPFDVRYRHRIVIQPWRGFVIAAAASAIGLGNLWRFPYEMPRYGGWIFVLIYLVLALTFGYA